ncbi:acetate--CoA ligase [Jejudonia soesokkakensis]|uniref:Acetate--CoA ligase n=1 Tax=Jejudonia soesokkakensis TaxID=1323432 RepID=A0ABW2MYE6_9FLAO
MDFYHIQSYSEYKEAYKASVKTPETFWESIAEENFSWKKKWNEILSWDFTKAEIRWFDGAKLNITENCIDRHLDTRGEKTALLFEPNSPSEAAQHISYNQLYEKVCRFANVLKQKGIEKGDRVCIYLPMIPELAVSVLACARIGAVHSVVFAGFSAQALSQRILDCDCKMVITSDGAFRGNKTIPLKNIVDNALEDCPDVTSVLVVRRTGEHIKMKEGRDEWLLPLLDSASISCIPEVMDAEDPLFILYTSGSTGKPKGMVHTTAGYMVYSAYTFKNVFQYQEEDIYWCTADIGWITGHSYIVYGPLANGATTVMFEGVPSYPDYGRFWEIVAKHKVTQFYTAPTAIRALAKEPLEFVKKHDLTSLKILGTVGEPINEEAWHWYNNNIGDGLCPIVDTWWQTETGGILISALPKITPAILPTFATLPLPGIQPVLVDDSSKEIKGNPAHGKLCIKFPWPGMARTIWGDHKRYKETYFSAYQNKYFTGDGALRNDDGYYRITGRVDDVIIVSGHNLGTAPIEDVINTHEAVAESAIVGFPHDVKGNALYGFVTLKHPEFSSEKISEEINQLISTSIGPIAKLDKIQFTEGLPKTRSGKIMRRILRKIASGETESLGDISTLLNPEVVQEIIQQRK